MRQQERRLPEKAEVAAAARAAAVALRGCQLGKGGGHVVAGRDLLPASMSGTKRGQVLWYWGTKEHKSDQPCPVQPGLLSVPKTAAQGGVLPQGPNPV